MSLQLPWNSALCGQSVQASDWEVPWVAQSSTQLPEPVSLLCVCACVSIKYIFLSSLKKIMEDLSVSHSPSSPF